MGVFGGRSNPSAEPAGEGRHDGRVMPAAAADQPLARRRREMPDRSGDRGGGHLGQGRGAVRERETLRHRIAEIVAVERFRRRAREIRMLQKPRDMRFRDPARPAPARRRNRLPGRYGAAPNRRSAHCPARCRRRGCRRGPSPIQVTLPTPPRFSTASGFAQRGGERGVVERRERRPLPAGGDIGAAEIADDIDPGQSRQQRAVADLPGAALARAGAGSCARGTRSARSRSAG